MKRDRGYRWSERDPVLEEVCRLITDSGLSALAVAEKAKVSKATIDSWLIGKTWRPYNFTVDAVLYALGYQRVLRHG